MPSQHYLAPSPGDGNGAAEDAIQHEGLLSVTFTSRRDALLVGTLSPCDDLVGYLFLAISGNPGHFPDQHLLSYCTDTRQFLVFF